MRKTVYFDYAKDNKVIIFKFKNYIFLIQYMCHLLTSKSDFFDDSWFNVICKLTAFFSLQLHVELIDY